MAKSPLVASIVRLTWVVNEPGSEHEPGIEVTQNEVWWQAVKNTVLKALANDQLDAQFLYFIIRLLQSSTCFEQRRAYHQEVKLY